MRFHVETVRVYCLKVREKLFESVTCKSFLQLTFIFLPSSLLPFLEEAIKSATDFLQYLYSITWTLWRVMVLKFPKNDIFDTQHNFDIQVVFFIFLAKMMTNNNGMIEFGLDKAWNMSITHYTVIQLINISTDSLIYTIFTIKRFKRNAPPSTLISRDRERGKTYRLTQINHIPWREEKKK